MNRYLVALCALSLLLTGAHAHAQDKRGLAVNVGVGASRIKDKDGDDKFDGDAFGYAIGAEYRFSENFAVATSVFGLGTAGDDFNGVDTDIEVKGADAKMRFIMPASDGLEFFGTAGYAWYTADLEPGGSNGLFGDTAVELGLGLDIGAGNLTFRLAGTYFDGASDEAGSLALIGLNYRF